MTKEISITIEHSADSTRVRFAFAGSFVSLLQFVRHRAERCASMPFVLVLVMAFLWSSASLRADADQAPIPAPFSPDQSSYVMPGDSVEKRAVDSTSFTVDSTTQLRRQPSDQRLTYLLQEHDYDFGRHRLVKHSNWWHRVMQWISERLFPRFDYQSGNLVLKFVIYASIIITIVLLLWFWTSRASGGILSRSSQAVLANVLVTDEELAEEDLRQRIREALDARDFRRALRFSFLAELRALDTEEHIHLDASKTNTHYVRELSQAKGRDIFGRLAAVYEWVWYGENTLSEAEYFALQSEFDRFREMRSQTTSLSMQKVAR